MTARRQFAGILFRMSEWLAQQQERFGRPLAPDRILVLTAFTANIASYGQISTANKARYAQKHGYAFRAITSGFIADRPPAWSKIVFIRKALRRYRWVFWSDADALIMNDTIRLESLIAAGHDVYLTRALAPFPHINTGHMLYQRSAFSALFLRAVWSLDVFRHDSTWEQRAINYLLEHHRFRRVAVCPNRRFNSYGHVPTDPDPYQPGDFIIHFPGIANRSELIASYAAAIQVPAADPRP